MSVDRCRQIAVLCWALACSAAAAAAVAADGLLEGELERWLDDEVAPELGETLSRHPRFKGETVRLVSLTPGGEGHSNELARAVERRLRQRLLAVEGVRLAVDRPRHDCEPPRRIDYLVRIEVSEDGRTRGRVHIAVVDVAESVWVSGISHQWRGRLSSVQRRALTTPVSRAVRGTAGSPIPLDDADAVVGALKADLACTLPPDLDGALFIATPDSPALSRVALALQGGLMFEPVAAVTADRDQADWLLTLEAEDSEARVRELKATLADRDGEHRQRVASVFVSGTHGSAAPVAAPATPRGAAANEPSGSPDVNASASKEVDDFPGVPGAGLLSTLHMRPAAPEGVCDARRSRVNSCVDIGFTLYEPAYLFVVTTRQHRVVEAPCGSGLRLTEAGLRRHRLRVPPGSYAVSGGASGPDAGLYVLAVRERHVAERLREALGQASPACGRTPAAGSGGWLSTLERVLEDEPGRVVWRALHVAHDTSGIVAL